MKADSTPRDGGLFSGNDTAVTGVSVAGAEGRVVVDGAAAVVAGLLAGCCTPDPRSLWGLG